MSFKKIIETIQQLPDHVKIKIHASGSRSVIGSESKDTGGTIVSETAFLKFALPANNRNKNIADVIISLLFILTFPVHIILQKKPLRFYENVFDTLFGKKTWVGAAAEKGKHYLKSGVLTTTGMPPQQNTLPLKSLEASDKWYAADYSIWQDITIVFRGYKFLSA